jgi:hypothetical protein
MAYTPGPTEISPVLYSAAGMFQTTNLSLEYDAYLTQLVKDLKANGFVSSI